MDKSNYQLRILERYGFLASFDGEIEHPRRIEYVEGETFGHWCKRILQRDAQEVRVYAPSKIPRSQRVGFLRETSTDELFKVVRAQKIRSTERGVRLGLTFKPEDRTEQNLTPLKKEKLKALFGALLEQRQDQGLLPVMEDIDDRVKSVIKDFIDHQPEHTDWESVFYELVIRYAESLTCSEVGA